MMKVAVITIKDSPNYGGILQAYALQYTLRKMGCECDLIDYITEDFRHKFTFFGRPPKMTAIYWIYKKVQFPLMLCMKSKMLSFYKHMSLTKKYANPSELKDLNNKYDAFITGSDQVWACDLNCFDSSYFLSFAYKCKKRIAYAASFGRTVEMLSDEEKSFISTYLENVDNISLREASGVEIVKTLVGRDSCSVIDPTLIVNREEWESIAIRKAREPYLLCYLMQSRSNDTEALRLAKRIAKQRKLRIIKVCRGLTSVLWGETLFIPTVEEWIGLFANAEYIITNSFHGIAFSINFNKDFNAFIEGNPESGRNSRLMGICDTFDLRSRLCLVGSKTQQDVSHIDYARVNIVLDELRKKSIGFLCDSLALESK